MKNKYSCSYVNTSTHTKRNQFLNQHANKNLSRHSQAESQQRPESASKYYQAWKGLLQPLRFNFCLNDKGISTSHSCTDRTKLGLSQSILPTRLLRLSVKKRPGHPLVKYSNVQLLSVAICLYFPVQKCSSLGSHLLFLLLLDLKSLLISFCDGQVAIKCTLHLLCQHIQ